MQQKIIWTLLLIIGFFSNMVFLSSCEKKIDKPYFENRTYKNLSSFDVKINTFDHIYSAEYSIDNNDSLVQRFEIEGVSARDGIISTADSVTITFNNERTSNFDILDTSRFNIIRSSVLIKREKNESFYRYVFTIDDYNYAGAK